MSQEEEMRARPSALRVLLILPFAAVLWVPFYNAAEPSVLGVPFFYMYQLVWILLTSVVIGAIYLVEHRRG
jgi:hypothetical protein